MHSATSEAQFPTTQPYSSPHFPAISFLWCWGFLFLFFPVSFFLVLLGPWPREKGIPGTLPSAWSFTSSSLPKWKIKRPFLGGGVICCFVVLVEVAVVILDLQKVPENSGEESTSCYQLLSVGEVGYAACRYEGVCWATPFHGNSFFALIQQCPELTSPTEG